MAEEHISAVHFISLDKKKNDTIKSFPLEIRSAVSYQISNLVNKNSDIIIDSLINDINTHPPTSINNETDNSWLSNLSNKNFDELYKKINSNAYKLAIINYFKDLIRIIRYITENPKISLRKVALKFSFHPNIISDITKSFLSEEEYYDRYLISTSQSKINRPLLIFLDSRKTDILSGQFIPNIPNLSVMNPSFNKNSTRLIVNKWLKKNTRFVNLSDLIRYFKPTPTQLGYSLVQQKGFVIKYSKIFIRNFNFNLPNNFIDVVLTIYGDILNFINPNNTNNAFDIFYESMTMKTRTKDTVVKVGIRSEKSLAGVLVYYSLLFYFYKKKSLTQKEKDILINEIILERLETLFNFSKRALRKKSPVINNYLAKIPK